ARAAEGLRELSVGPRLPRPALVVAAASPTARALADLGRRLGFAVSVAALAEDLAPFESADTQIAGFDLAGVPRLSEAFIVVATQGKRDREALRAALASPAPYVAFIGSRRKAAALSAGLVAEGVDPALLARLRSRAGLAL